jgi:outer membrane protein TolC
MKTKILSFLIFMGTFTATNQFLSAQESDVLDGYVRYGLEHNLALQQRNISVERAMISLKEAKSLFLPTIGLNAGYTTGDGGRAIDLPLGDLMNPVYKTLNLLTQTNSFPTIENSEVNFFPNNQYDIHVRTSMAVFNSDIIYNRTLQEQQILMKDAEADTYSRELVYQIKNAYFNYLMAIENAQIYKGALVLVKRNVEINESLLANGKGLPAKVLRSKSELENVEAQVNASENQVNNAKKYFNFLLNKQPEDSVIIDFDAKQALENVFNESIEKTVFNREELKQIGIGMMMYETQLKMSKSYRMPKVSAFADLGSQAENWKFNAKALYYLIGFQVDVPLFNRSQKFKIDKVGIDIKSTLLQKDYIQQQLQLGLDVAQNEMNTTRSNYQSSLRQVEAASAYFRLIEKGYKEGVNSLIEYLDARNQLTNAQILLNINTYKVLQAAAAIERQSATYSLNK